MMNHTRIVTYDEALNDDHLDPREMKPSLGLVNQQLHRDLKIGC